MRKYTRVAWLILVTWVMIPATANACDPKTQRCQKVDELLAALSYKDQVAGIQMGCRGKARQLHPDELERKKPAALMGLIKNTGSWEQVNRAFDMYVDEACGGEELVYLVLGAYRHAWDRRLPGEKLDKSLELAKAGGRTAVAEDADFVKAQMNQVVYPLLVQMEALAEQRYQARIKGVVTGEALEIAEGDMCSSGDRQELTTLTERMFPRQPQRSLLMK